MDFAAPLDAGALGGSGASPYMKDLADKLAFAKRDVLALFAVPAPTAAGWVRALARFAIHTFVLHASLAKPLGERGKLQLTTDMTELEFALSAFLAPDGKAHAGGGKRGADWEGVGDEYRALRAMRCVPCYVLPRISHER